MGRWGRQSPVAEMEPPPPPTTGGSPQPLPRTGAPFVRQSSFTKIGNILNSAITGKKSQSKLKIVIICGIKYGIKLQFSI